MSQQWAGKDADAALDSANITVNKNTVPNDPRSPFVTSGMRIGTPAVTTRGMKEGDMIKIVEIIDEVLMNFENEDLIISKKEEVNSWMKNFPLYKN